MVQPLRADAPAPPDPAPAREPGARMEGSPGESARLAGLMRLFAPLLATLLAAGYVLGNALPFPGLGPGWAGLLLIGLAILGALLLPAVQTRLSHYQTGARGEEQVARRLARLPSDHVVYHAFRLPDASGRVGDVDHIVVGPRGLFVVETFNWPGTLTLRDGEIFADSRQIRRSPLRQARTNAERLQNWIKEQAQITIDVRPVVCFVDGKLSPSTRAASEAHICTDAELNEFLLADRGAPPPEGLLLRARDLLDGWIHNQERELHS